MSTVGRERPECAKSLQLCPTLCNPMDCSLPGSSVHRILQARILEWTAMPSSRGSSWPRDRTCISYISLLHWQADSLPLAPPGKPWERRGSRKWGLIDKGYKISFADNENVLKLTVVMVAQICAYTNNYWIVLFKRSEFYGIWIITQAAVQ